jgi:hypothetical protein
MRVEFDRVVRRLPDNSLEFPASVVMARTPDDVPPISDADDEQPVVASSHEDPSSLRVVVEWFQALAGAEWQWS